jgi:hypothetical protein
MRAERLRQELEGGVDAGRFPPRVDLLNRDDIGSVSLNALDNAIEIAASISADAAVDVPRHDPNSGGEAVAVPRPIDDRLRIHRFSDAR